MATAQSRRTHCQTIPSNAKPQDSKPDNKVEPTRKIRGVLLGSRLAVLPQETQRVKVGKRSFSKEVGRGVLTRILLAATQES